MGFSNLSFRTNQTIGNNGLTNFTQNSLFLAPNFGKFITDNTLVSGGFSLFSNLSRLSVSSTPNNVLGLNFLAAQYFGKGKLRGLGQMSFNANLSENTFSNLRRSLNGDFEFGGAYFVNEFTSLQLLYRINIFMAQEGLDTQYFSSGVAPNLGLSLRTFLMRNREGIENLSALNSIKKGATTISLSSRFRNDANSNLLSFSCGLSYFFADNFFANVGISASKSKNDLNISDFSNSNFALGAGYYLRIVDKIYGKLSTRINRESQYSNFFIVGMEDITNDRNAVRWNTEIGAAFFLGRHKLEPGIGLRLSNTQIQGFDFDPLTDFSPSLFINYEWFLAQNFALATSANLRFNEVFYTVGRFSFSPSEPEETMVRVFDFTQNRNTLSFGFKWYFSTPVE